MGDPKKPRKKYLVGKPKKVWQKQLIQEELQLVGEYGLRNKRELWLARSILKIIRRRARTLLSMPFEERMALEAEFKHRLYRMGFIDDENLPLDYILLLSLRSILERRLQTLVYRRGLARSIYEARQLVAHGHIAVKGRRVTSPGFLVNRDLEPYIGYAPTSPLAMRTAAGEA